MRVRDQPYFKALGMLHQMCVERTNIAIGQSEDFCCFASRNSAGILRIAHHFTTFVHTTSTISILHDPRRRSFTPTLTWLSGSLYDLRNGHMEFNRV